MARPTNVKTLSLEKQYSLATKLLWAWAAAGGALAAAAAALS